MCHMCMKFLDIVGVHVQAVGLCTCRASSKASSRSTLSWAPKNLSNTCSCSGRRREVLASGLVTVDVVAAAAAAAVAARAFSAPDMKILIIYLPQEVRIASPHVLLKTCSRAVLLQPACLAQWYQVKRYFTVPSACAAAISALTASNGFQTCTCLPPSSIYTGISFANCTCN